MALAFELVGVLTDSLAATAERYDKLASKGVGKNFDKPACRMPNDKPPHPWRNPTAQARRASKTRMLSWAPYAPFRTRSRRAAPMDWDLLFTPDGLITGSARSNIAMLVVGIVALIAIIVDRKRH